MPGRHDFRYCTAQARPKMEHKSTFNRVATLYGTARRGYPDELVEDICRFADLADGDSVLEVGCGAGQATTSFAKRGHRLTALDPGAELIEVAKGKLVDASNVSFIVTPFETFDVKTARFKLIYAAQSWHWIPREVAFAKASKLLQPSGVLAVFGHVPGPLAEPMASAFEKVYRAQMGRFGPPPEAGYLPSGPFARWFAESGCFGDVVHRFYHWNWRHSAASYVAFARTRSDHQMLPADKLEPLLSDIRKAIEANGNEFDWPYETHLYMAKRL